MQEWRKQAKPPVESEWDAAVQRMVLAHRTNQLNGDYLTDLGRLYEWRALSFPLWSEQGRHYRRRAAQYYREAVARRPSFGFAWAHLTQAKVLNQELSRETLDALAKAVHFAPYEPGVQKKVIRLGLALWQNLPVPLQQQVQDTVSRAVQNNNDLPYIIQTARDYNWLDHLRPLLTEARHRQLLDRTLR